MSWADAKGFRINSVLSKLPKMFLWQSFSYKRCCCGATFHYRYLMHLNVSSFWRFSINYDRPSACRLNTVISVDLITQQTAISAWDRTTCEQLKYECTTYVWISHLFAYNAAYAMRAASEFRCMPFGMFAECVWLQSALGQLMRVGELPKMKSLGGQSTRAWLCFFFRRLVLRARTNGMISVV